MHGFKHLPPAIVSVPTPLQPLPSLKPSPLIPAGHLQWKPPFVLTHLYVHGFLVVHSSISCQKWTATWKRKQTSDMDSDCYLKLKKQIIKIYLQVLQAYMYKSLFGTLASTTRPWQVWVPLKSVGAIAAVTNSIWWVVAVGILPAGIRCGLLCLFTAATMYRPLKHNRSVLRLVIQVKTWKHIRVLLHDEGLAAWWSAVVLVGYNIEF